MIHIKYINDTQYKKKTDLVEIKADAELVCCADQYKKETNLVANPFNPRKACKEKQIKSEGKNMKTKAISAFTQVQRNIGFNVIAEVYPDIEPISVGRNDRINENTFAAHMIGKCQSGSDHYTGIHTDVGPSFLYVNNI